MKKFLSILLAIAMITALFTMGSSVSAEESYRVTYSAEEITDLDTIAMLATMQRASNVSAVSVATRSAETPSDELVYTQLLEVREYADGTKEEYYVQSSQTGSYYDTNTSTAYGYAYTLKLYYNIKYISGSLYGDIEICPTKVQGIVVRSAPTRNISTIGLLCLHDGYTVKSQSFSYSNSGSTTQTFTMNITTGTYYDDVKYDDLRTTAQFTANYSTGSYTSFTVDAFV